MGVDLCTTTSHNEAYYVDIGRSAEHVLCGDTTRAERDTASTAGDGSFSTCFSVSLIRCGLLPSQTQPMIAG